jgi:hypothetical protein
MSTLLGDVKLALRIKTDAFNDELNDLIAAAKLDLGVAGVVYPENENEIDSLVRRAIITYCRVNFGTPDDYDRLKRSYDEQKAQLATNTGHTDWGRV